MNNNSQTMTNRPCPGCNSFLFEGITKNPNSQNYGKAYETCQNKQCTASRGKPHFKFLKGLQPSSGNFQKSPAQASYPPMQYQGMSSNAMGQPAYQSGSSNYNNGGNYVALPQPVDDKDTVSVDEFDSFASYVKTELQVFHSRISALEEQQSKRPKLEPSNPGWRPREYGSVTGIVRPSAPTPEQQPSDQQMDGGQH